MGRSKEEPIDDNSSQPVAEESSGSRGDSTLAVEKVTSGWNSKPVDKPVSGGLDAKAVAVDKPVSGGWDSKPAAEKPVSGGWDSKPVEKAVSGGWDSKPSAGAKPQSRTVSGKSSWAQIAAPAPAPKPEPVKTAPPSPPKQKHDPKEVKHEPKEVKHEIQHEPKETIAEPKPIGSKESPKKPKQPVVMPASVSQGMQGMSVKFGSLDITYVLSRDLTIEAKTNQLKKLPLLQRLKRNPFKSRRKNLWIPTWHRQQLKCTA
jgi:hypothetical protein